MDYKIIYIENKQKYLEIKPLKVIAVLNETTNDITGIVKFSSSPNDNKIKIEYDIYGLKDGKHGFHIHEYGDLTKGCKSAGDHFNPTNQRHGGLNTKIRHAGDLGNILSTNKKAKGVLYADNLSLQNGNPFSIIGRSIIVHELTDDLGSINDPESHKTGKSGARIACGVIGIAN